MRHRNKKIKLGRKKAHRSSMLANMACSLIEHKRINTTVTKAKALKRFIEPLVTKTKDDSTHNRRVVFKYLRNKESITELFRTISNKIGDRPGGYTRIIKLGKRMVSRMLSAPVRRMIRRSIPKPIPPAGGMPCSSAVRKSVSMSCCSSPT